MQGWQLAVLAHSMGNQALTQALMHAQIQALPAASSSISHSSHSFIFAAPDVSQTKFQERLQLCSDSGTNTLYCDTGDIALMLSKMLRFYTEPRAGDSSRLCMARNNPPEFDTIDCSTTSQSPFDPRRHSYVFKHPDVVQDILHVFQGKTPDERINNTNPPTLQKLRVAAERVWGATGDDLIDVLKILPRHRRTDLQPQPQPQPEHAPVQEAQPRPQSRPLSWCCCLSPHAE
jgi:esterase/lipase superfamily enzyme